MRLLALACSFLPFCLAAADPVDDYGEEEELGKPMLGITMTIPSTNVQIDQHLTPDQGVYVLNVFPDTAADDMDVHNGDVIIAINNTPITSMTDLRQEIAANEVGNPVTVVVRRDGQDLTLESYLGDWPESIPYQEFDPAMEQRYRDAQMRRFVRRADQLDGLKRLEEKLQQDLIDLDKAHDERARALAQSDPDLLADLMQRGDQARLLRGLDGDGFDPNHNWRFAYSCTVNRTKPVEPACDGVGLHLTYGFTVDNEGL